MKTSQLFIGDRVFVRLPYEGGVGYGIIQGTRPREVLLEWTEPPNGYYKQRSPHWITARSVVRHAKAPE